MLTVRRWLARPQGENGPAPRRRSSLFSFDKSRVCVLMCAVCLALMFFNTHQTWAARSESAKANARLRQFSAQAAQLVVEMNDLKTMDEQRYKELSGKLDQIVRQLQER
jgi:hypothetical protein